MYTNLILIEHMYVEHLSTRLLWALVTWLGKSRTVHGVSCYVAQ